jgi:hypothetical protein
MRPQRQMLMATMFFSLAPMALAVPTAAQEAVKPKEVAFDASQRSKTAIPKLRSGTDESYIEVYGQINKGLLIFDDGGSTLGYFPVDNDNSSTRGGIRTYAAINEVWSIGGNAEAEWNPYSTANVDQLNRDDFDWNTWQLRKLEFYTESRNLGKLSLGQGSMASDGTAESDLSGTSVVGYSKIQDMAGGQFFRLTDGTLSSVHVKNAFTNFDGLQRKLRARYDTPKFAGFSLGTSVGTQVIPNESPYVTVWDVAARYENTIGDYKLGGAVAFSRPGDDENLYDGSVSVLHEPSGLSLTLAAAYSDQEPADARYGYVKLGYQADFFEVGKTAMSIDYYVGGDIAGPATDSTSFGAQLVQNLDYYQTELYLGARSYDYEDPDDDFDHSLAFLAGARVKF